MSDFQYSSTDGVSVEVKSSRKAEVQVLISKYVYDEDPESFVWESDVFINGQCVGGAATSEMTYAYDMAQDIMYDHHHPTLF